MRFTNTQKSDGGKEFDKGLRKQLISSVKALLSFKKSPIPNATALSKRLKVGNHSVHICDIIFGQCICSDL